MFKILIVEDLPSDAELCEREVKKVLNPCRFLRVETREDFLKALADFQPGMVLCDYKMPRFDGMTALNLAVQHDPDMPFILVTGSVSEDIAVECIKAGAWDYVIKGHIKRLGSAVLAALDEKQQRVDRRLMADKLKENEERYRAIVENTAEGIILQEASGEIITWNKTAEMVFGVIEQQAIGHTSIDRDWRTVREDGSLFPGEEHPSMKTLATGKSYRNVIMGVKSESDQLFWININTQPLFRREENKPYAVIVSFSDITEQKKSDILLEQSRNKFQALVETTNDFIWEMDPQGVYTYCSPQMERLWGFKPGEMLGKSPFDLLPSEEKEQAVKAFSMLSESGTPFSNMEMRSFDSSGRVKLLEISGVPFFNEAGKLHGYRGITRDITERKQAVEALNLEAAKRSLLVEQSRDGIVILDNNGAVYEANQQFAGMLGYTLEEAGRLHVWDWEDIHPRGELLNQIKGDYTKKLFETKHRRKDGSSFDVEISSNEAVFSTQKLVFCICRDITERKRIEEQILNSKALLQAVVDSTPDRIAVKDTQHRYLLANRSLADAVNLTPREIVGKLDDDILDQEQILGNPAKGIRSIYDDDTAALGGNIVHGISNFTGSNNELKMYDTYRIPLRDSEGNIYGVLAYNRDITELYKVTENLKKSYEKVQKVLDETVAAIATICETRDPYTAGHQNRTSQLACAIARGMDMSEETVYCIKTGATLHDIGKLYVPAEILSKPGKLTDIEFAIIKNHPQVGYDIIKNIDFPSTVGKVLLQHHERLNGSGYPQGLTDGDIAIEAKIMAVADVVEAMSSHRPYRPSLGLEKAIEEINQNKGILYDETIVDVCTRLFNEKQFKFE
jgi:PAS domain S-box-containing protein/putative nucleotidyltransferase with HDIG domain